MIIEVNLNLFNSADVNILKKLEELTKAFLDKKFIWDPINLFDFFFSEDFKLRNSTFTENYLSLHSKQELIDSINVIVDSSAYITEMHRTYLMHFIVGDQENELSIDDALKIIHNPSKVIVENAVNDWKFIKGIAKKFSKNSSRKSIHKLLVRALEDNCIIAENAGGKGQIIARYQDLCNSNYKGIDKYKIAAILDSDRLDATTIKHEQKLIAEFFKNGQEVLKITDLKFEKSDKIFWHILYKRELENYLHKDILIAKLPLSEKERLRIESLDATEQDFIDFEEILSKNDDINIKFDLPELFLTDWGREYIDDRCSHHLVPWKLKNGSSESITEVEHILLNLALLI